MEEWERTATRQWYSQGLAELGSSIFISANSNGGRGENISGNFLVSLVLFSSLKMRGHKKEKRSSKNSLCHLAAGK